MSVIERRWTLHAVNEDNRRTANAMVSGPMIGPGDDAVEVVPADQLQGVVEDRDALLGFVRAYANWHTTADLNRLDREARLLIDTIDRERGQ